MILDRMALQQNNMDSIIKYTTIPTILAIKPNSKFIIPLPDFPKEWYIIGISFKDESWTEFHLKTQVYPIIYGVNLSDKVIELNELKITYIEL